MVSANCLILQSIKLRHREGKCLAQGHQGLELESKSEPRAPYLSFHLLLGPHLTSVSISMHLCPTPDGCVPCPVLSLFPWPTGLAELRPGISGLSNLLQEPLRNRICPFISSPHYCLCPLSPSLFHPFLVQPIILSPSHPHPTVLTRWTSQRASGQRQTGPGRTHRWRPSSRWKTDRHAAGTLRPGET